jgi:hypothetical protein
MRSIQLAPLGAQPTVSGTELFADGGMIFGTAKKRLVE